ncbi:MAG: DsrE family protein [Sulfuriferula sp.]|nr:DsrE family protein [Sulfuriferula sp.]
MTKALIVLHAAADASDNRALTALRLAGAMMADNKDVALFLVEAGAKLVDPALDADNPCRTLFSEMLEVGMQVYVCGATMRKQGLEEGTLPAGATRSSMKALSALMSEAGEIISF